MDRGALKADAKDAMRQSKTSPYITALIYCAISYVITVLSAKLMRIDVTVYLRLLALNDVDAAINYIISSRPSGFAHVIDALLRCMMLLLNAGFIIFVLKMVRRQENSLWNLMDGFQHFLKIIGLWILMGLYVFLWSLLLVIPGIVAAYRYRQALYLLLDHPDMRIGECIRESKRLMRGHKAELFVLDLSFIGWALLSAIPFVSVYTLPYMEGTYAMYYSELRRMDARREREESW